jgi:hypothetical protein
MPPWGWALASFILSFILAVIGFAVAWGQVNQKLLMVDELKRGLYNPDGTLVYMPAEECEKRRDASEKLHSKPPMSYSSDAIKNSKLILSASGVKSN